MKSIPKISTLLYATDLGDHTRPVFKHAIAEANAHNASIIMLHVVEPLSETARSVISAYMPETAIEEIQKDGMKKIIAQMKERIGKFHDEECKDQKQTSIPVTKMVVLAGRPSEQILTVAEEYKVDMIVMGQSTKKVLGAKVMGSTTRQVTRLAKVPTLIIPNM
jgi:nucleotide-binding universal stress UspA family protein